MRLFFFTCICLLFCITSRADTIDVPQSTSPSGKYYLTIKADADLDDASEGVGRLQIRDKNSKRVLGDFDWVQYGAISTTGLSIKVFWNPESNAFAVTNGSKGWEGTAAYTQNGMKWVELSIPDFKPTLDPTKKWSDRHKGSYVPSIWVKNDILKLSFDDDIYCFDKDGQIESISAYWVYLQLSKGASGQHFTLVRSEAQ